MIFLIEGTFVLVNLNNSIQMGSTRNSSFHYIFSCNFTTHTSDASVTRQCYYQLVCSPHLPG